MTDQKSVMRSKYEKYEMLLVRPHAERTNKLKKITIYFRKTPFKRTCQGLHK